MKDAKSAPMPAESGHLIPDPQKRRRGEKIGENLRKLYEDVTQEAVPDAFFELLEAADKRGPEKAADDSDKEGES